MIRYGILLFVATLSTAQLVSECNGVDAGLGDRPLVNAGIGINEFHELGEGTYKLSFGQHGTGTEDINSNPSAIEQGKSGVSALSLGSFPSDWHSNIGTFSEGLSDGHNLYDIGSSSDSFRSITPRTFPGLLGIMGLGSLLFPQVPVTQPFAPTFNPFQFPQVPVTQPLAPTFDLTAPAFGMGPGIPGFWPASTPVGIGAIRRPRARNLRPIPAEISNTQRLLDSQSRARLLHQQE